jgi:pSer/pThr/pTyr-binding forkhead associated (FHA) protein
MTLITLRVLDGADRGRVFADIPTPVSIGREDGNTVQLNDERVSRFHLKIQEDQEKVVLTDLESTNGTKVNGEDTQLRILRGGEMITVGRSVLLFGSREQIAQNLASQRADDPRSTGSTGAQGDAPAASLDYELNWSEQPQTLMTYHPPVPPELPTRLSPGQAAQFVEVLDYIHVRIRNLLATVRMEGQSKRVTLDERRWQALLDIQAQLARYLREISEPSEE